MKEELIQKFQNRDAHVAVIGLGYVGLPLCVAFAEAGYRVTGIDLDRRKVDAINAGQSYIGDITTARLEALVTVPEHAALPSSYAGSTTSHIGTASVTTAAVPTEVSLMSGRLDATTDFSVLTQCDAVSICVPTPLNKTGDPDISYIISAGENIARHLHSGFVVVLESTTYPGTTKEVLLPTLEANRQGLAIGKDFFVAFSPERIDPGRADWSVETMPKVMGGVTPACLEVTSAFYRQSMQTLVPVSSPEVAELTKLFENTFRSVNIGLANELLLMCDKLGLDAWEVLDAAATKPFGFMKFTPGPGLGGHCIPVDPHYLSWKLRTVKYTARFIELASEINTSMPSYWVQKAQDMLNDVAKPVKNSRVLVLGVAYKKDVADLRESPALDIIHLLEEKGADVSYHDPYVDSFVYEELEMCCVDDLDLALDQADCVVIATDHSDYDWDMVAAHAPLLVDTRHVLNCGS